MSNSFMKKSDVTNTFNASEIMPTSKDKKPVEIGVIIGSTRPTRIGKQITEWVLEEISKTQGLKFTLVDLMDFALPLLDEPVPAGQSDNYVHEHTKKWSKEANSYQGYIFVIPEHNAGYPASVKNAVDYLYKEWNGKPVIIISYGFHGGERSANQFKQVLTNVKLRLTETTPALTLKKEMFNEKSQLKSPEQDFASYVHIIRQAVKELRVLVNTF
jgi:NAD(P)H-dependent FMN reductase